MIGFEAFGNDETIDLYINGQPDRQIPCLAQIRGVRGLKDAGGGTDGLVLFADCGS